MKVEKTAEDHWNYVAGVLAAHGEDSEVIDKCGHHYRTAFAHGWKHAIEDEADRIDEKYQVCNLRRI